MIKVNLLPKIEIQIEVSKGIPLPLVVLLAIICGSVCGFLYFKVSREKVQLQGDLNAIDQEIAKINADLEKNANEQRTNKILKDKYNFITSIKGTQKLWADFFDDLKANTPKDVWYTGLDVSRSENLYSVQCKTFSASSVGNAMLKLSRVAFLGTPMFNGTDVSEESSGKATHSFFLNGSFDLVPAAGAEVSAAEAPAPDANAPK